jgi:hypothetical protein
LQPITLTYANPFSADVVKSPLLYQLSYGTGFKGENSARSLFAVQDLISIQLTPLDPSSYTALHFSQRGSETHLKDYDRSPGALSLGVAVRPGSHPQPLARRHDVRRLVT